MLMDMEFRKKFGPKLNAFYLVSLEKCEIENFFKVVFFGLGCVS